MRHKIHFGSIGNIDVFGFCTPQIVIVEIAALQNLTCLNMNFSSCRYVDMQLENSRKLLPHIEDQLAGRSMKQFFWFKRLMNRHRKAHPFRQFSFGCLTKNRPLQWQFRQRVVPVLTVVKVRECNFTAPHLPRFVRADHILRSVRIRQMQLRNQLPLIAVKSLVLKRTESKPRLIPAVSKQHTEHSLF